MSLLLWALWIANAWAEPLVVADPDDVVRVKEALEALWPDGDIDVVQGGEPNEGLFWDGEELVWRRGSEVSRAKTGDSPEAAVVLARSWLRPTDTFEGWDPPWDRPTVTAEKERTPIQLGGLVGVGFENVIGWHRTPDAVRFVLGLRFGNHVEAMGSVGIPLASIGGVDESVQIPEGAPPLLIAATRVSLLGVVRPLKPRPSKNKWTTSPLLFLGAGVHDATLTQRPRFAPELGFGADVAWDSQTGVRLSVIERLGSEAGLFRDVAISVDLVLR